MSRQDSQHYPLRVCRAGYEKLYSVLLLKVHEAVKHVSLVEVTCSCELPFAAGIFQLYVYGTRIVLRSDVPE